MSDRFRAAYLQLVEESRRHPGDWQPSPHEGWKPDYFSAQCVEEELRHFRRSKLSGGLINFPDRPVTETDQWRHGLPLKERLIGAAWLWNEYQLLRRHVRGSGVTLRAGDIRDNAIGHPCGYRVPGVGLVTEAALRQAYYRHQVVAMSGTRLGQVLEIGAGYGALCGELFGRGYVQQYFIVDLPENMILEWFYLGTLFGERVHLISHQSQLARLPAEGIVILAPWLLPLLFPVSRPMDLGINTMSFQHMTFTNVAYYFHWLEALRVRRLYLVNRDFKREPSDVETSRYPIPVSYRRLTKTQWVFTNFGNYDELWYEWQEPTDVIAASHERSTYAR